MDAPRVVVTAGGDDALDRVCRAFLAPGRRAVTTSPTFEMIPRAARAVGAAVTEVAWWEGPFPVGDVVRSIDEAVSVIFVVTPNNPTGSVATAEDVRMIAEAAPGAVVCVDLAYTEYAAVDLTTVVLSLPNVVVVRTLSKAWGLAGLRVGYAAGNAGLIDALRAAGGPYPASALSLEVAAAWLGAGEAFMRESASMVRAERTAMAALLRERGVGVIDSQANFVLARFADADEAWEIADALARCHGIGVRRFPRDGALGNCLRISCPCDADAFARLRRGLGDVLSPSRSKGVTP
jgi:histidinol-phosphate aminotransferase